MPVSNTHNAADYIKNKLRGGAPVDTVVVDDTPKTNKEEEYLKLFTELQQYVVNEKASELEECLKTNNEDLLKQITEAYIMKKHSKLAWDEQELHDLVHKCVDDMIGYSFLSKYFAKADKIEEININAWNIVEVRWCDGRDEITDDSFHSPEHAKDVIKRILRPAGKFLDENHVCEVSYIGKSIRIATAMAPLVDEDVGIAASIRFIHSAVFTLDNMIAEGFLLPEMGSALSKFINHGVSVIVCGATGSGKTTMLNALLGTVPDSKRITTLEDGTREFELVKYDKSGKAISNRVHMQTRHHKDEDLDIDLQTLLDLNLKFDPEIVVVGEMVSEEAFIASEMARTGHTVMTTIHTRNAFDAYHRMFTLGIRKYNLNEKLMMKFMVDAFPIVVYCKQYPDGVRRIQSILEGRYVDDQIIYNELWHFEVKDNIVDENGCIHPVGEFVHLNSVSDSIKEIMIDNGATRTDVDAPDLNK